MDPYGYEDFGKGRSRGDRRIGRHAFFRRKSGRIRGLLSSSLVDGNLANGFGGISLVSSFVLTVPGVTQNGLIRQGVAWRT